PGRSRYRTMRIGDGTILRLKAEALRKVNMDAEVGREVMAAPWISAIARSRTAIASNRLFHGGDTPDAAWMRQNRFRSFAGYPLQGEKHLFGVLAVFSRHPLSERSFRLLKLFAGQLAVALKQSGEAACVASGAEGVSIPSGLALDEAMKLYIENALAATSGKIEGAGGAAALLCLHPNTLRSRISKLGVQRP
ncbi:GAF domain-containing protein, partial [Rhodothermus sp. AH-315-K08]|nr:GAF domain-containing protein [Rhodothermus sp. AH-315-K08]